MFITFRQILAHRWLELPVKWPLQLRGASFIYMLLAKATGMLQLLRVDSRRGLSTCGLTFQFSPESPSIRSKAEATSPVNESRTPFPSSYHVDFRCTDCLYCNSTVPVISTSKLELETAFLFRHVIIQRLLEEDAAVPGCCCV